MAYLRFLILTLIVLTGSACELLGELLDETTPPPPPQTQLLYVYIECCFTRDLVEVYADDQLIFADSVSTPVDGLADRDTFSVAEGVHHFRIRLNGALEADSTFSTTGMKVVVVRYDTYDPERHIDIPLTLRILPLDYIPVYD